MCTRSPEYARPNRPHQRARLPFTGPYVIPNHPQILATMQKKKAKNKNKKNPQFSHDNASQIERIYAPHALGVSDPEDRSRARTPSSASDKADLGASPNGARKNSNEKTGGTTRRCSHPSRNSAAGSNRGNMSVKAKSS